MRRLGLVAVTLMLTLIVQTAAVFAVNLQIIDSHPRDGATGVHPINAGIKVYFDRDVSSAREIASNAYQFVITNPDGERPPVRVLYDPNNPEMVLVVLMEELSQDTEYTLTISGDFRTTQGNFLGDDYVIRFTTRDMQRDMNISIAMMLVFLVVIMFVTSRQAKHKAQKEAEEKAGGKVNPYKVSKQTGKSVTDIVAKAEKQKRKREEAEAKLKAGYADQDDDDDDEFEEDNDNHSVQGPRPISAFSTYRSGKKAKAEAAAKKKAQAGTTHPKKQSGKAKNKNKKK